MPRVKVMAADLEVCKILFFTKQGHTAQVQDHSWSYKGYHVKYSLHALEFSDFKIQSNHFRKKKKLVDFSYLQNSGASIYMGNWESYKIL